MRIILSLLLLALSMLVQPLPVSAAQLDPYQAFPPRSTYEAKKDVIPAANATDICAIIGSSTKIIRVQKVRVTSSQTTAGTVRWDLVKRSSADTGGGLVAVPIIPYDSGFVTAGGDVITFSSNPTLGTALGVLTSASTGSYATATAAGSPTYEFNFVASGGGSGSVALRSAAETLALNFQGAALPAGFSTSCDFVWTEENKN